MGNDGTLAIGFFEVEEINDDNIDRVKIYADYRKGVVTIWLRQSSDLGWFSRELSPIPEKK